MIHSVFLLTMFTSLNRRALGVWRCYRPMINMNMCFVFGILKLLDLGYFFLNFHLSESCSIFNTSSQVYGISDIIYMYPSVLLLEFLWCKIIYNKITFRVI